MGNTRGSLLQSVHNWSYRSISNIGRHHIFLRDEHQQLHVQDWAGHGAKPRASGLIPQVQVLVALVMIYLTTSHFTGLFIPGRVSILLFQGRKPFATQNDPSRTLHRVNCRPSHFPAKPPLFASPDPSLGKHPCRRGTGLYQAKYLDLLNLFLQDP